MAGSIAQIGNIKELGGKFLNHLLITVMIWTKPIYSFIDCLYLIT
jgi:hypothetical protein